MYIECIQGFLFEEILIIITSFVYPLRVKYYSYHKKLTFGQTLESQSQNFYSQRKVKDYD